MNNYFRNNAISMHANIVKLGKVTIILIANALIFSVLAWLVMKNYKSPFWTFICITGVFVPFFFIHNLKKRFTEAAFFKLEDNTIFSRISPICKLSVKSSQLPLNEIASYAIGQPAKSFTSIKFNLKTGKTIAYSFIATKIKEDELAGSEIIDIFNGYINAYNYENTEHRIFLQPTFLASRKGLYLIGFFIFLFLISVILHIIYKINPLDILAEVGILLQLVAKRNQELNLFNKMNTFSASLLHRP